MSLRLKLFLAFMAIVSVMVGVGIFSFQNSWRIQKRVANLTSTTIAEFERDMSLGQALEVEGAWQNGVFLSEEIERLSHPRRPKLRGAVDSVDPADSTFWIYGVPIKVDTRTKFIDDPTLTLEQLHPGDRIEVSCGVYEDGSFWSRKIRTKNLKESNKIKGIVTAVNMDGVAPDSLAISGILIILDDEQRWRDPHVELRQISLAARMSRAAQDCHVAALYVLSGREVISPDGEDVDARTLLTESIADLKDYLGHARTMGTRAGSGFARDEGKDLEPRSLELDLWFAPLEEHLQQLEGHVDRFLHLVDTRPDLAASYLLDQLEPYLQEQMLPLIEAYQLDAEEAVALEVENISAQAGATARGLIATGIVALVFALALGRVVFTSISRPILRLKDAAEQIGKGRLETRVTVESKDELGVLAATINHMASELAANTVSIGNLENIIDSMAGALIVLSPGGTIISANRAAATLLGYTSDELIGLKFGIICSNESGDVDLPTTGDGHVRSEERTFRRKDGSTLPVSFAGASLRSDAGPPQGFVCVAQDLTERKSMEAQLRRSLDEKELLLREVHHRVKNNLQVISSLLDLQAGQLDDVQAQNIYEDSQRRVRSMALIHQQLYNSSDLDRIDFGAYLNTLVSSLFTSFGANRGNVELRTEANESRLGIDQALACGLIINELVTNSLKHAFEPGSPGVLTIRFETTPAGFHRLEVSDNGRGIALSDARGTENSLGMSLVSAFVEQLQGQMTVKNEAGTAFCIEFPGSVEVEEVLEP